MNREANPLTKTLSTLNILINNKVTASHRNQTYLGLNLLKRRHLRHLTLDSSTKMAIQWLLLRLNQNHLQERSRTFLVKYLMMSPSRTNSRLQSGPSNFVRMTLKKMIKKKKSTRSIHLLEAVRELSSSITSSYNRVSIRKRTLNNNPTHLELYSFFKRVNLHGVLGFWGFGSI